MSDDRKSNDAGIARLVNGQLTERSAKLARRGLESLDAKPEREDVERRKLSEQYLEGIPLPARVTELLSQISRSYIDEGRTDIDGLIDEFEELLGDQFDKVEEYLPEIFGLEEERANGRMRLSHSLEPKEPALPGELPPLEPARRAFLAFQKEGRAGLAKAIVKEERLSRK